MLQRSLLPESIPAVEGWELSADYRPAAGGRVGGDWYDAFELRDGRLVVLLGDVAGHGLAAAGTMAQLRNALRANLFAGAAPGTAISDLNSFSVHLMPRTFATVIVARIDIRTGHVEASSAGHLMPFITGSVDDTPTAAPIKLSPPIGVRGATYVTSEFVLEPGQFMVMFSDGLVERRTASIDEGLQRLASQLAASRDRRAPTVSAAMTPNDTDDDVTVISLGRR